MDELPEFNVGKLLNIKKNDLGSTKKIPKMADDASEHKENERKEKIRDLLNSPIAQENIEEICKRFSMNKLNQSVIQEVLVESFGMMNPKSMPSEMLFERAKTEFPSDAAESLIQAYEAIAKSVLDQQGWELPDIRKTDLSMHKRIEVVVHPLWTFLHHEEAEGIWKKAEGNIDAFTKGILIHSAQAAHDNLQKIPEKYLETVEMVQELEALSSNPPADTFRLFVLPRSVDLSPIQKEILDKWIKKNSANKSVGFMESALGNTGAFLKKDKTALNEAMQVGSTVEISGGYMRACMLFCLQDLLSLEKSNTQQFSVNFDAATSSHVFRNSLQEENHEGGKPYITDDPNFIIKPPVKSEPQLWTEADVKAWVASNDEYYQEYRRRILPGFEKALNQKTNRKVQVQ